MLDAKYIIVYNQFTESDKGLSCQICPYILQIVFKLGKNNRKLIIKSPEVNVGVQFQEIAEFITVIKAWFLLATQTVTKQTMFVILIAKLALYLYLTIDLPSELTKSKHLFLL